MLQTPLKVFLFLMFFSLFSIACTSAGAEQAAVGNSFTSETGLEYVEIEAGDGPEAEPGDTVSVHYIGTLEDGTQFDNSVERGEPIQFSLGTGRVIPGWEEGIDLMKVGGKAQLIIPPELAYGDIERPGIPAGSTLIFEVELLEVIKPPEPTEVADSDYTETDSGLKYYAIAEGSGAAPQTGDQVSVHYSLWLEDGTLVDSSATGGVPFNFVIGTNSTIPGWEEGVLLMKEGGKAQLLVPPDLGYGPNGSGPIPANANLIFELEVVGVESGQ